MPWRYLLRGHTPVPVDESNPFMVLAWGKLLEDVDARLVALTPLAEVFVAGVPVPAVHVSTVFLGIAHYGGIFETMVFGGPLSDMQIRYETWEQAEAGHARMVARVLARQLSLSFSGEA